MKLPLLFKSIVPDTRSSWPWPSCNHPRTLSFRSGSGDIFKTINSAFLDPPSEESWFTNSTESGSFSTASDGGDGDLTETVIRGARSERLFFEPGDTSSILEEAKVGEAAPFRESTVMSLDSQDPYSDFRESMAEMVEAHGIKEWCDLEDLLSWYLRVNGKHNHEYIVGAFIDLLVGLAIAAPISTKCASSSISTNLNQDSPSSTMSLYTSFSSSSSSTPRASSELDGDDDVKDIQEIEDEEEEDVMIEVHVV